MLIDAGATARTLFLRRTRHVFAPKPCFAARGQSLAQLALAFVVVAAYSLAINGSLDATLRTGAGSAAFVAGVAFAALTPSWVSGVTFLALVIAAIAAFAASAWVLSALLGLGAESGPLGVSPERAEARTPTPQRHARSPRRGHGAFALSARSAQAHLRAIEPFTSEDLR